MPLSLIYINEQCRDCERSDPKNYPSLGLKAWGSERKREQLLMKLIAK
jgi:hypothetical protein